MKNHLKISACTLIVILLNSYTCFSQVSLKFATGLGSTFDDFCYDTAIDPDGNIYAVGAFKGTVDFDKGPGIFNLTSFNEKDAYLLKIDSNGNFIWAVHFGGVGDDDAFSVALNDDGEIFLGGRFHLSGDFDPGPSSFILTGDGASSFIVKLDSDANFIWAVATNCTIWSLALDDVGNVVTAGYYDGFTDFNPGIGVYDLGGNQDQIYIQKLDENGNFLWAIGLGSSGDEYAQALVIDNSGSIWIYFSFQYTVDVDPGAGVFNLIGHESPDYGILKVSSDGEFQWAGSFGGEFSYESSSIGLATDNSGNIFVGSDFNQTIDFNPGVGVYNKTSAGTYDAFVLKLDNNGNFIWVKTIPCELIGQTTCIETDNEGNVYTMGQFNWSADFDPGIGINTLYAQGDLGNNDVFIQKLDPAGNFVWAITYGGIGHDQGRSLAFDSTGNIIITGHFSETCDFDAGAQINNQVSNGAYDSYIQKLRETICADLTLVIDSAQNANCNSEGYASCHAISGIEPYEYSWNTDPITYDSLVYFPTEGFYDVTVIDANACMKSSKVLISGPGTLTEIDMNANVIYPGFAPGFPSTLTVDVYNEGCIPASGNFNLILDLKLNYIGANPEPDFMEGNILSWNFGNMIYDSLHSAPQVFVTTPGDVLIGDTIHLEVQVITDGDVDTTNDSKDYDVQVVGSFDPNNKLVFPDGACAENYITRDQILTYTIQFQNTGTADAVNIYLLDTLSARLNKNSLRVIASSHDMVTEYLPGDIIKFIFNNIYLPDSNSNEPESHGYVIFEIEPKTTAPDYAVIENSAAIYFDFNEPIITNSTLHTIVDEIPVFETEQTINICEGESLTVGANIYTSSGVYTDNLISADGCLNTMITTLNVVPANYAIIYAAICEGEFYSLGDSLFSIAGEFNVTMDNMLGCDSTVNLHLIVNPSYYSTQIVQICEGESYIIGGSVYTESGDYEDVFVSFSGCDSVINTLLIVHPQYNAIIDAEICAGESYEVGGNVYTELGVYEDILINMFGCDSTIITNLNVLPEIHVTLEESICIGENYLFNGIDLYESGNYSAIFTSVTGCDSIVDLELTVETINVNVITELNSLTAELEDATYQWVDCNNNFNNIDGATEQTFLPLTSGNYAVVIEQNNCSDTSACYFLDLTGVEEKKLLNNISIYPNPATDQLIVTFDFETSGTSLNIYNNAGALVYNTDEILSSQISINLNNFAAGIYYIKVNNLDQFTGLIFVKK